MGSWLLEFGHFFQNNMLSIEQIEIEIENLKKRNKKVEADKAWETSWFRKTLILFLTYTAVSIFFIFAKLPSPFLSAIIPSLGFFLSTLTLPLFKKWWIRKYFDK